MQAPGHPHLADEQRGHTAGTGLWLGSTPSAMTRLSVSEAQHSRRCLPLLAFRSSPEDPEELPSLAYRLLPLAELQRERRGHRKGQAGHPRARALCGERTSARRREKACDPRMVTSRGSRGSHRWVSRALPHRPSTSEPNEGAAPFGHRRLTPAVVGGQQAAVPHLRPRFPSRPDSPALEQAPGLQGSLRLSDPRAALGPSDPAVEQSPLLRCLLGLRLCLWLTLEVVQPRRAAGGLVDGRPSADPVRLSYILETADSSCLGARPSRKRLEAVLSTLPRVRFGVSLRVPSGARPRGQRGLWL